MAARHEARFYFSQIPHWRQATGIAERRRYRQGQGCPGVDAGDVRAGRRAQGPQTGSEKNAAFPAHRRGRPRLVPGARPWLPVARERAPAGVHGGEQVSASAGTKLTAAGGQSYPSPSRASRKKRRFSPAPSLLHQWERATSSALTQAGLFLRGSSAQMAIERPSNPK